MRTRSRWTKNPILMAVCLAAVSLPACAQGRVREATLLRDAYGTPHIFAESLEGAMYAFGRAQAEDHLIEVFRNYRTAAGRLAEVDGAPGMMTDILVRRMGIPGAATRDLASMTAQETALVEAFCAGLNDYIAAHRDAVPEWIDEAAPADIACLGAVVNVYFLLRPTLAELGVPLGSNQFAVNGAKCEGAAAILSMDPHLPWEGITQWYEAHVCAEGYNVAGIAFPGLPVLVMGHNERLGWCMTVNSPDCIDLYSVAANWDEMTYRIGDQWLPFEKREEKLAIRTDEGMDSKTIEVLSTRYGPVMKQDHDGGTALSLRVVDYSPVETVRQFLDMGRARSFEEWRAAVSRLQLLMFNLAYADADGTIYYLHNARVPIRPEGVTGEGTIDGSDPANDWLGVHPIDDLPQVLNPPEGFIQNCNCGPWHTTGVDSLSAADYPVYMNDYGLTDRSERMLELLETPGALDFDGVIRTATDSEVIGARAALEGFFGALGDREAPEAVKGALEVLRAWDHRASVDSVGAALFDAWTARAGVAPALHALAEPGASLTADELGEMLKALGKAVEDLRDRGFEVDTPWGEVHRIGRGDVDAACSGFGRGFRTLNPNHGTTVDGRIRCNIGSSYRMVVEFSDQGVRAVSTLPFGVSGDPASPHYSDQSPLHGAGVYKPAWFTEDDVRGHLESETLCTYER